MRHWFYGCIHQESDSPMSEFEKLKHVPQQNEKFLPSRWCKKIICKEVETKLRKNYATQRMS